MLTVAKIINERSGYEPNLNFCIVKNAKQFEKGSLYICKILNRFWDKNKNPHFVVEPLSNKIEDHNYDYFLKLFNKKNCRII